MNKQSNPEKDPVLTKIDSMTDSHIMLQSAYLLAYHDARYGRKQEMNRHLEEAKMYARKYGQDEDIFIIQGIQAIYAFNQTKSASI